MRILHFIPSIDPATGGPVEGLRQRCNIYRKNGHEVEVASLDSPERSRQWEFPVKVDCSGTGWGVYGYSPHAMSVAEGQSFTLRCGVCGWHLAVQPCMPRIRALAGTDIPWAIFVHGMLDPYFKKRYPLKHLKKRFTGNCPAKNHAQGQRRACLPAKKKNSGQAVVLPIQSTGDSCAIWHVRPELRFVSG